MATNGSRLRDVIIGLVLIAAGAVTLLHTLNIIYLDRDTGIQVITYSLLGLGVLLLIAYFIKPAKLWLLIVALCLLFLSAAIGIEHFMPGQREIIAVALFVLTALAFFAVFLRNPDQWWAILVFWTCLSLAGIAWLEMVHYNVPFWPGVNWRTFQGAIFLGSVAIGFFFVWLTNVRTRWWALMTSGLVAGVTTIPLIEALGRGTRYAPILMFFIAGLTFLLLWLIRNEENKLAWAIYPAAVLIPFSGFLGLVLLPGINRQLSLSVILMVLGLFFIISYFFKRTTEATAPPEPERFSPEVITPTFEPPAEIHIPTTISEEPVSEVIAEEPDDKIFVVSEEAIETEPAEEDEKSALLAEEPEPAAEEPDEVVEEPSETEEEKKED